MSLQSVIIPDIFAQVVTKTAELSGIDVKYMHGVPEEIEANLIEATRQQANDGVTKKYPLIILFHDFPVNRGNEYYGKAVFPKIIIATMTDNKFKSDKRYNETFKPILYPLYEAFLSAIANNKNIVESDRSNIQHTAWDRLFWGTKPAGTGLNDYVDAIEIQNLQLTFQQFC